MTCCSSEHKINVMQHELEKPVQGLQDPHRSTISASAGDTKGDSLPALLDGGVSSAMRYPVTTTAEKFDKKFLLAD